jgi:hypothetical protein
MTLLLQDFPVLALGVGMLRSIPGTYRTTRYYSGPVFCASERLYVGCLVLRSRSRFVPLDDLLFVSLRSEALRKQTCPCVSSAYCDIA